MRLLSAVPVAVAVAVAAFAAPATAADDRPPTLLGRAILPSDAYQPGPPSGAFITGDNGVTPPFPGQPIPDFSAVLDAGHGTFWAMPDNGYGAKPNSGDFLLRLYRIQPDFKTAAGGTGTVAVLRFLQLRDEFDLRAGAYTGRTWQYHVDAGFPDALIGDLTALDQHRFVLIERDDAQGADARQKKVYLVDLRRVDADGFLEKRLVLDLLRMPDPEGISLPPRPGEFGVGDPFSFPLQSVESLEVLDGERLLIASDNNYPFSDGRWVTRDRPDDTELIVVHAPALR